MNSYKSAIGFIDIYALLNRIGITANYTGCFHIAYSIFLSVQKPRRLVQVTKWLYPAVAKHYGTTAYAVERNIRTVVNIVWMRHQKEFESIFKVFLKSKPGNAQFLAIITMYLIGSC